MNVWCVTDPHFEEPDDVILSLGRPLNYEKILINALKSYCKDGDTVLFLGDIITNNHDRLKDILSQFAGDKILIRGNHDVSKSNTWFKAHGFNFVCDEVVIGDILLTHKPVAKRDGIFKNIHGHFHNFPEERWEAELKAIYDRDWHYLLSLEESKYLPVNFIKLVAKLKTKKDEL